MELVSVSIVLNVSLLLHKLLKVESWGQMRRYNTPWQKTWWFVKFMSPWMLGTRKSPPWKMLI